VLCILCVLSADGFGIACSEAVFFGRRLSATAWRPSGWLTAFVHGQRTVTAAGVWGLGTDPRAELVLISMRELALRCAIAFSCQKVATDFLGCWWGRSGGVLRGCASGFGCSATLFLSAASVPPAPVSVPRAAVRAVSLFRLVAVRAVSLFRLVDVHVLEPACFGSVVTTTVCARAMGERSAWESRAGLHDLVSEFAWRRKVGQTVRVAVLAH
jgi:hypothetical protein